MIAHLNGKLVEKNPTHLIIECAGVGYWVKISLHTFSKISTEENIKIYTQLQVREDAHTLYGFYSEDEREMFNHLISVSGIGASTAIIMLSAMAPDEIASAILTDQVGIITGVKGIGAKTAQRLIIELKDKVAKSKFGAENIITTNNTNENDALIALIALGFDRRKAEKAVGKVSIAQDESVEAIIKEALKVL